jgi:hypothetical protein
MNPNNYTIKSQEAIAGAQQIALSSLFISIYF